MSPTSYQTAPPRISIINNAHDIVKLAESFCRRFSIASRERFEASKKGRSFRINHKLAVEENITHGQERSERKRQHRAGEFERATSSSSASARTSSIRHGFSHVASRPGRTGSPGN